MSQPISLSRTEDYYTGRFQAMASPCELLIDVDDEPLARQLLDIAHNETLRIEQKFSRYRDDSIIQRINRSAGETIEVDAETAALLDYAQQCYQLSGGLFDITSGVLRQVWRFDGSDRIPSRARVKKVLPLIGWPRIDWQPPTIRLPRGMEIDFGGIGKEYAVDRSARLIAETNRASVLINYGGDLFVNRPRRNGRGWFIGIENPDSSAPLTQGQESLQNFELRHGGIATSGDARRYLLARGKRYSHILNPTTGWPVEHAPRSVTVAAATCIEAGLLATFAMLHGAEAERFLNDEGVQYWCTR